MDEYLTAAIEQAKLGLAAGGIPIGAVLVIDGEPVPYALARLPSADDFRGNLAKGGTGKGVPLSDRDRWICDQVAPVLNDSQAVKQLRALCGDAFETGSSFYITYYSFTIYIAFKINKAFKINSCVIPSYFFFSMHLVLH